MAIPGLNPDKCAQRNRIASLRGYAAGNVRLLQSPEPPPVDESLARGYGKMPKSEAAALEMINALRTGGEPLTAEQVWIHYAEAANTNFIPDRYMFLAGSTLRNIAVDAARGVAFMNSHRTGGLSEPTELPFGRTFCGRYEETGDGGQRSLVGIYLIRGEAPNGANGPTTDALHRMIEAGTLFDVSVGLYGGHYLCDVCGHDLYARDPETREYLCDHIPGTHYEMDEEQQRAQKARGVTDGKASVTYAEGRMGEVSAVYDGAVPGAGFVKAVNLARSGALPEGVLAQCRRAYACLARRHDFTPHRPATVSVEEMAAVLAQFQDPEDSEGSPTGLSFDEAFERAHTSVASLIERAQGLKNLRASQGRTKLLSDARVGQLLELQDSLSDLLTACEPRPSREERARALRIQALAIQADVDRLSLGA